MFLAAASLAIAAGPRVWRCFEEVYDLSLYRGSVVAATSGGALIESDGKWKPLGIDCPAPLRKLLYEGGELCATDRTGLVYRLRASDETWAETPESSNPPILQPSALPSPAVSYHGMPLHSVWGSRFLVDDAGANRIPRDPAGGDYALLAEGDRLLAGTPDGIYEYDGAAWKPDPLPAGLPLLRPTGIAFGGPSTVVGGLTGLFVRTGTVWSQPSRDAVRQILKVDGDAWVLYGNGSVDKLDLAHNQLVYDAVNEGAKRPWTSCLAAFDGVLLFGGQGGWIERTKKGITEHYFPEIDNDVVMAATGKGAVRWIGTQKAGLFRYGQGPVCRWNPGNGLPDTWVTALLHTPKGLYVATSGSGLFLVKGDSISPVGSPTQRPRQLTLYKGEVVVGGMDGAWILDPSGWRLLPTNHEETTALVAGTRLVVCTAAGVYLF